MFSEYAVGKDSIQLLTRKEKDMTKNADSFKLTNCIH